MALVVTKMQGVKEGTVTAPLVEEDKVNHPSHYTGGGIECIAAIEAALTPEEFQGFCKGNVLKYIWRERKKNGREDVKKALWYLNKSIGGF